MKNRLQYLATILALVTLADGCSGQRAGVASLRQVSAELFLKAFRQGKADQYKGYVVTGEARLAGSTKVTHKSGKEEVSLLLLIGSLSQDGQQVTPIETRRGLWEADVDLKPLLMFELSGAALNAKQDENGKLAVFRFSGRYDGASRKHIRNAVPVGEAPETFQIPLLVAGSAQ